MTSTRATFERYLASVQARDHAALEELSHPDFEDYYPQSGEVTRGMANMVAMMTNYPGSIEGLGAERIVGGEEHFVRTPSFTIVRIDGAGDHFTGVQRARYPDGSLWYIVVVAEMRDGLVYRTETFFAPAFDPPEWRARWVEIRQRSEPGPGGGA